MRLRRIDLLGLATEDVATKSLELDAGELVELAILVPLVPELVPLAGGSREAALQSDDLGLELRVCHGTCHTRPVALV